MVADKVAPLPKHFARLRINAKILYAFEAEPESNRAELIGEWAGKISRSISIRIIATYIELVFQDCVASNRVQVNVVIRVSCNYLVNSISMSRILCVHRQSRVEGIIIHSCPA